jgi:hypothetical protein
MPVGQDDTLAAHVCTKSGSVAAKAAPRTRGSSSQVSLPTRTAQRRGRSYDRPLRWACFSGSLWAGYPLVMVKCSTPQAEVAPALLPSPL